MIISFSVNNYKTLISNSDLTMYTVVDNRVPMVCDNQSVRYKDTEYNFLNYILFGSQNQNLIADYYDAMKKLCSIMTSSNIMINNVMIDNVIYKNDTTAKLEVEYSTPLGIFAYGVDIDTNNKIIGEWLYKLNPKNTTDTETLQSEECIFSRDLINNVFVNNFEYPKNRQMFEARLSESKPIVTDFNLYVEYKLKYGRDIKRELYAHDIIPYYIDTMQYSVYVDGFDLEEVNTFLKQINVKLECTNYSNQKDIKNISGEFIVDSDRIQLQSNDKVYLFNIKKAYMLNARYISEVLSVLKIYATAKYGKTPDVPTALVMYNFGTCFNPVVAENILNWIVENNQNKMQLIMFEYPYNYMNIIRTDGIYIVNSLYGISDDNYNCNLYSLSQFDDSHVPEKTINGKKRKLFSVNYMIGRYG